MPTKPAIYARAELADPEPLLPKPRPTDPRQLALKPRPMVAIPKQTKPATAHLEKSIEQEIRLALSAAAPDLVLWRHSASKGVHDDQGNFFRGGLPPGAPDLIGILKGRWFSLETKSAKGRLTEQQAVFHRLIWRFGGFAAVVRSPREALDALERARRGETS